MFDALEARYGDRYNYAFNYALHPFEVFNCKYRSSDDAAANVQGDNLHMCLSYWQGQAMCLSGRTFL